MTRPRVYVSDPERQRKYRQRRRKKLERYNRAMELLGKSVNKVLPGEGDLKLATEIEQFLLG